MRACRKDAGRLVLFMTEMGSQSSLEVRGGPDRIGFCAVREDTCRRWSAGISVRDNGETSFFSFSIECHLAEKTNKHRAVKCYYIKKVACVWRRTLLACFADFRLIARDLSAGGCKYYWSEHGLWSCRRAAA